MLTGEGTPLDTTHIGSTSIGSLKLISIGKFTNDNPCVSKLSFDGFAIKDQITQAVLARGSRKGQLLTLYEEQ